MKEEKKVEYLELIYDLVFVYMIGRDNALLEHIIDGVIVPEQFLIYIVSSLSIIQIWNFTTFYINMFGRNGIRDHIFLFSNMYLLYFLGEGTRSDAGRFIAQYHIAWGLILVNIGVQYLIELRNHKADVWNRDVIRRMSITLFVEAALVFVASGLPFLPTMIVSALAILFGIIMTFVNRSTSVGGQVDFMHLSERAMLYVVFTFGEMVIAVAGYFNGGGAYDLTRTYFTIMIFLLAVGLFSSYEIVYNHLVDREGDYTGMTYMLWHIFIVFMLNNVTVAFGFMRENEMALVPRTAFLSISIVGYFFFLFMLSRHFHVQCRRNIRFIVRMILISVAYILASMLLRNHMMLNILVSVLYAVAVCGVLYRLKKFQDRCMEQG